LAEQFSGGVGLGRQIAVRLLPFAPIWTELELTITFNGTYEGRLLRHSLFPSNSFYYGGKFMRVGQGGWVIPLNDEVGELYHKISDYDGMPNMKRWKNLGWGVVRDASPSGPVTGSPWGVSDPNDPNDGPRQRPPGLPLVIEDPIDNTGDFVEDSFDEWSSSTK
jgi:hypothetical protein